MNITGTLNFAAPLTIDGESGDDTVNITGSVTLPGQAVNITAETIKVTGGTLSTSATTKAGDIKLNGYHITLDAGAQLLARGATPGKIDISVIDTTAIFTPLINYDSSSVDFTINSGAKIEGGDVTILATANSQHILDSQNIVEQGLDTVAKVIEGLTQIGAGASVAKATPISTSMRVHKSMLTISLLTPVRSLTLRPHRSPSWLAQP